MTTRKGPHKTGFVMVLAAAMAAITSAKAGELAGKWYSKLDAEPVITINKAGSGYSAALEYPDTIRSVRRPNDLRPLQQSIHKEIAAFEVAGNEVRFTIRNTVSSNGDLNSARDEYDLTLSNDGQLAGTVRHTSNHEGGLAYDHVPVTVTPVTLFPTDFAARSHP